MGDGTLIRAVGMGSSCVHTERAKTSQELQEGPGRENSSSSLLPQLCIFGDVSVGFGLPSAVRKGFPGLLKAVHAKSPKDRNFCFVPAQAGSECPFTP